MEDPPGAAEQPLAAGEVRRRATGGAMLLAGRSAFILALGVVANIVLARLLPPRDFGLVALGAVLVVLSGYIVQGGFGAALVRRTEPPTQRELEAVNGLQLAATFALVVLVSLIALPFGRDGLVVIVMVASLPLSVVRAPATVLLERQLSYRTIAKVDVIEALAFYVWSLSTVALGMGVWGMASAIVVRALAGTIAMLHYGPLGLVRPRWGWAEVRPLVGFGAKLQTISVVGIARDQGLNLGIASIAGVATLGVWNLAYRVLQAPTTIFTTVARVSFPAMSRLIGAGRDPRPTIERGVALLTVIAGIGTVGVIGFAPALPALVGDEWRGVPATLAWSCAALVIGAPIYIMAVGYLYAVDAAGAVLRSMATYAAVWFAVALPLVDSLGAPAIGIGWIAASAANALGLAWQTRRRTGAAIATNVIPAGVAAGIAGGAGWAIATAWERTVLHGVLGALGAEAILLALLAVARPALLRSAYALLREAMKGAAEPAPDAAALDPVGPA